MKEVDIKGSDLIYDGFFSVKKLHLRFKLFSGEWSAWVEREQICRRDAVAVILYDPKLDSLVLVEQIRIGALNSKNPWMLEIVAGLLEPDEDPELTAKREAQEEANCSIKKLIPILDFYNSPGAFTEKTKLYCGIVDASDIHRAGGLLDEQEDILVHVLPAKEALRAFSQQEFELSASTAVAFMWFKQQYADPQSVLFSQI
jgi:ADP-ribose pyrophosphatase